MTTALLHQKIAALSSATDGRIKAECSSDIPPELRKRITIAVMHGTLLECEFLPAEGDQP